MAQTEEILEIVRQEKMFSDLRRDVGRIYFPKSKSLLGAIEEALDAHGITGQEREELQFRLRSNLGHNGGKETAARKKQQSFSFD